MTEGLPVKYLVANVLDPSRLWRKAVLEKFFRIPGPAKISECGHTRIACRFVRGPKIDVLICGMFCTYLLFLKAVDNLTIVRYNEPNDC